MARKVKCPHCGAKNAGDSRRCRICGGVVNEDVYEDPAAVGPGRVGGAGGAMPPSDEQLRQMGYEVKPPAPGDEAPVVAPDEHFDPNEFELPWTHNPPPPPSREDPVVAEFEHFDPNALEVGLPEDPRPST
jgi:hypothetical protein